MFPVSPCAELYTITRAHVTIKTRKPTYVSGKYFRWISQIQCPTQNLSYSPSLVFEKQLPILPDSRIRGNGNPYAPRLRGRVFRAATIARDATDLVSFSSQNVSSHVFRWTVLQIHNSILYCFSHIVTHIVILDIDMLCPRVTNLIPYSLQFQ